jgi:hypothetical protein
MNTQFAVPTPSSDGQEGNEAADTKGSGARGAKGDVVASS